LKQVPEFFVLQFQMEKHQIVLIIPEPFKLLHALNIKTCTGSFFNKIDLSETKLLAIPAFHFP